MKKKRFSYINDLVQNVERQIMAVNINSLTHRSWIIDLYNEYCKALFYTRFEECPTYFYTSIINDYESVLSMLDGIVWNSLEKTSLFPPPTDFFNTKITISDKKGN